MSDEEITVDEVQRLADAYATTDPNGFTVKVLRWAVEQYERAEVVEHALEDARDEGRQEIRDQMNDLLDEFAPTAVSWWDKVNAVLLPPWKKNNNTSKA